MGEINCRLNTNDKKDSTKIRNSQLIIYLQIDIINKLLSNNINNRCDLLLLQKAKCTNGAYTKHV